jgi:hypothetical protein
MCSVSYSTLGLAALLLPLNPLLRGASAAVDSVQLRPRELLPLEWAFEKHSSYILNCRGGSSPTATANETTETTASTSTQDESNNHNTIEMDIIRSDKSQNIFSLFQVGDGSESDPDGIPDRYLRMQLGRRDDARQALDATLAWRKEHHIDQILLKPQPKFDICKSVFPHYFVGRDTQNHVILVQRPALIDIQKAKANSLTNEELLMHYVFVNEYLWQIAESDEPLGTMTSILDLKGLNLGILKKTDLIGFCKQFIATMDAHYPQRAFKTLIVNAPKWFNALYKLFSPLLRESTKAKIEIYPRGKKQDAALLALLPNAKDVFPPSVWSSYKELKKHKKRKHHHKRHKKDEDDHEDDHDDDHGDEADDPALLAENWTCTSDMEKGLRDYVSV